MTIKTPVAKAPATVKAQKAEKSPKVTAPKVPKPPKVVDLNKKPFGRRIAEGKQTVEEWLVEKLTKTPMTKDEAGAAINAYYECTSGGDMKSHQATINQYLTDSVNVAYFGGKLDKKYNLFCHKTGEGKESKYFFKPITDAERATNTVNLEAHKAKLAEKKAAVKEVIKEQVDENAAKAEAKATPDEAPAATPAK